MVDYQYLRPNKAQTVEKLHEVIKKIETVEVKEIENGTVLPFKYYPGTKLFGQGGCVDANGEYLEISGIHGRAYGKYAYTEVEECEGVAVYGGCLIRHWGHFLVECITRLWYALEDSNNIDYFVFFIGYNENYELQGNYREFFRLLGILDKVLIINKPTRFKRLIIPDRSYKISGCKLQ